MMQNFFAIWLVKPLTSCNHIKSVISGVCCGEVCQGSEIANWDMTPTSLRSCKSNGYHILSNWKAVRHATLSKSCNDVTHDRWRCQSSKIASGLMISLLSLNLRMRCGPLRLNVPQAWTQSHQACSANMPPNLQQFISHYCSRFACGSMNQSPPREDRWQ